MENKNLTPKELTLFINQIVIKVKDLGMGMNQDLTFSKNDIISHLEALKMYIEYFEPKEIKPGVEIELLNTCLYLDEAGKQLYKNVGTDSYVQRCNLHDAKQLIYNLTSKSKFVPMSQHKR